VLQQALAPAGQKPVSGTKRRMWLPSRWHGDYRLPPSVSDRLLIELRPLRNRDACFKVAVFLARFNASPSRMDRAFPIDRRVLAQREDLGLTEDQIRGAIEALLKVGFIKKLPCEGPKGRKVRGGYQRKPCQFLFEGFYASRFRFLVRKAKSPIDRELDSKIIVDSNQSGAVPLGEKGLFSYNRPRRPVARPAPASSILPRKNEEPVSEGLSASLNRLLEGIREAEACRVM
jgi:hypothetical protein